MVNISTVNSIHRYEGARSSVDTIFGQRFHPDFPNVLRSCDPTRYLGCGTYPTTSGGLFQPGIDVEVEQGSQVYNQQINFVDGQ